MAKVERITVMNLKAVKELSMDLRGCTAIITGGNDKGKTSFLRGLPDRLRGIKPEAILKQGENNGFAEWVLTTGERLRWEFNNTTKAGERLIYISDKDIKGSLSREICDRFFPQSFDVDKFLVSAPKQQRKVLQDLVGLDFADIDKRYDEAYKERTAANARYNDAKVVFDALVMPVKVEAVDIKVLQDEKEGIRAELNALYVKNKTANDDAKKKFEDDKKDYDDKIKLWEVEQADRRWAIHECTEAIRTLKHHGYETSDINDWLNLLPAAETEHNLTAPVEPPYPDPRPDDAKITDVDKRINEAHKTNADYDKYASWLTSKDKLQTHLTAAQACNTKLNTIETERLTLIQSAKMPEGFAFSNDGITYNGLAFTREQLSSSGIYIAALKLAAMTLGEVKTLHFDASFLDNVSLDKIEAWANAEGLQLLIERPEMSGGEISYILKENIK